MAKELRSAELMTHSKKIPDWYKAFLEWLGRPSCTGEWLYRGQAAKYDLIIPVRFRSARPEFHTVMLFRLDRQIARAILTTSPVLGPTGLYLHLTPNELALDFEGFIAKHLGSAPIGLPWVSINEIAQALAQHYGFPTLFIDLTLNPIVAAFFATHTFSECRYTVRNDEPGVVYRWPAVRESPARMKIPGERERANCDENAINAIDLSRINLYIRRPRNQWAVLATPVSRPFSFFSPESLGPAWETPVRDLTVVDMAKLPSCERFQLPPGAGHELTELTGVSANALFPDRIDLGYSYLSIIALLSLIIHNPGKWGVPRDDEPGVDGLRKHFNDGILTGQIILDRECFRLVPECPVTETQRGHTLLDVEMDLLSYVQDARKAIRGAGSEEISRRKRILREKLEAAASEEIKRKKTAWEAALWEAFGDDTERWRAAKQALGYPESIDIELRHWDTPSSTDWVHPEIDRRYRRVQDIVQNAGRVPAYAVHDPVKYSSLVDALPSDPQYEEEVASQVSAHRLWLPEEPVFPPLM